MIMPEFRNWIETRRKQEFLDMLAEIAVGGLAGVGAITVISGTIEYYLVHQSDSCRVRFP